MELSRNAVVGDRLGTKRLKILAVLLLALIIYGTNNTYVYYASLTPFGIATTLALLYIGFNGYLLGSMFLAVKLLSGFVLNNVLVGINVLLVLFVLEYLIARGRVKIGKGSAFLYYFLMLIVYIVFNVGDTKEILGLVVSIVLGVLYLLSCIIFLDATISKGLMSRINTDEKICGGVVLIIFSMGIAGMRLGILGLGLMIAYMIVLVSTHLLGANSSIVVGTLVGIGFSLCSSNATYVSIFVILTLVCLAFKCGFRLVGAIAGVLGYIVFGLLFDTGFSLGDILGLALGGVGFLLLPRGLMSSVSRTLNDSGSVAMQDVFNVNKAFLVSRIRELGKVFLEMDKVYRGMVKGNLNDIDAKKMLREEIVLGVCSKCQNEYCCFRNGTFMENCIDSLVDVAYERGKVLLIDLPEYMATNCCKVNAFIQYANNMVGAYKDYATSVSNLDTSRVLIAEQLCGVSRLLEALAKEVDVGVSLGNKYENVLKENLAYAGVVCLESIIYGSGENDKSISLIVKKARVSDTNIERVVSKTLNCRYKISSIKDSDIIGADNILLRSCPKYDIAFGSAVASKSGKAYCGDSHSVIDIGDGKYIMSICDGMGSGKGASNISSLTISLVENFYRAGFDNDIILSSVNKLLSLSEQENFSTIDLCLVDCKKGIYDFVKLGATSGYIIRNDGGIEEISSSGLPVGVLEDISPHITKKLVSPMDIVVLVSDGVSDALHDEILSILRSQDVINPQVLATNILDRALEVNGGVALDDMTVLCVRVFESV